MTTRGPPESALQGIPGGVPSVTFPHTQTWGLESEKQSKCFIYVHIFTPVYVYASMHIINYC